MAAVAAELEAARDPVADVGAWSVTRMVFLIEDGDRSIAEEGVDQVLHDLGMTTNGTRPPRSLTPGGVRADSSPTSA
jgi:hypothetical protein